MGNFNRRESSYNRDNASRETFKATCADCGKFCELPFRPTNGRPVYCRDCFKKHSPEEGRGRDAGRGRERFSRGNDRGEREMFEATCAKCGNKCRVPFKPTSGKDTYCSNCFEEKGGDLRRSTNGSAQQLTEINTKLDKILDILSFASEELEKENTELESDKVSEEIAKKAEKAVVKKAKVKKKPAKDK